MLTCATSLTMGLEPWGWEAGLGRAPLRTGHPGVPVHVDSSPLPGSAQGQAHSGTATSRPWHGRGAAACGECGWPWKRQWQGPRRGMKTRREGRAACRGAGPAIPCCRAPVWDSGLEPGLSGSSEDLFIEIGGSNLFYLGVY